MRLRFAVALCCITAGTVYCQRGPAPYYEDTNNVPVSPEVHADRTVTFRLFAPKASEVVLMGSPGILEAIKKPMPLQRDAQGVWSLTAVCECPIRRIRTWKCGVGGRPASSSCQAERRR